MTIFADRRTVLRVALLGGATVLSGCGGGGGGASEPISVVPGPNPTPTPTPTSPPTLSTTDVYVDSVRGDDSANGRTDATPLRTLSRAVALLGAEGRLWLARGSVWREALHIRARGVKVDAYGTGAMPQLLGSKMHSGPFASAGGDRFTTTVGYFPPTMAIRDQRGTLHKLHQATALSSIGRMEFYWSGGTLTANVDPAIADGMVWEIAGEPSAEAGITVGAASQTYAGIAALLWTSGSGSEFPDTVWKGCDFSFNADDGIDQAAGCTNFLIDDCTVSYNGRRRNGQRGPGDGSSAHDGADGVIQNSRFLYNTQTGVGNEPDTRVVVRWNWFEGNYVDYMLYNEVGKSPGNHRGEHNCYHNIFLRTRNDTTFWRTLGNALPDGVVNIQNNTMVTSPAITGPNGAFVACDFAGMTVNLRNNIIHAPGVYAALANYAGKNGTLVSENNLFSGASFRYQPGFEPTRHSGDRDGDPMLANIADGQFSPRPGSPALSAGVPLGYTRDYYGTAVSTSSPTIGAIER